MTNAQQGIIVGPLKLEPGLHADLRELADKHERSLAGELRYGLRVYRNRAKPNANKSTTRKDD